MLLHKRWVQLIFGAVLFAGVLACQTSDMFFVAQQATATPTRTPRPTFTPFPTVTLTPEPLPTQPPPPPAATRTPTKRPTARPATRVPTKPPAPPPPAPVVQPPPPPPAPKFAYGVNAPWCEHSGGSYIKGKVYDSTSSDANGVGGILVALGDSTGTNPWVGPIPAFDDGYYSFTLTPDGGGAKVGTFYVWLVDGNKNRISDMGGPIVINGLGPDAPGSCWAGGADFWRR
jgi:hypothetical protein